MVIWEYGNSHVFIYLEYSQVIVFRIIVNMRTDAPQLRQMFGVAIDRKEIGNDDWDVLRLR